MAAVILDESLSWEDLLPLTYARHVAEIRCGGGTNVERWKALGVTSVVLAGSSPFHPIPLIPQALKQYVRVDAALLANREITEKVLNLRSGEALRHEGIVWALRTEEPLTLADACHASLRFIEEPPPCGIRLTHPIDVFLHNGEMLQHDFALLQSTRNVTDELPRDVMIRGKHGIWAAGSYRIGAGAVLNTDEGPIILMSHAHVMEGAMLRGPIWLGEHSLIKMGAKIYGPTTIGPYCKVGGEISRSVFQGYANKAHDGFLGDSVIGEWCNLGADTNNSNLSNNYAPVKVWSYRAGRFIQTPHQFVGLILGDHSKSAINTMFNTATVVGFSSNVFGAGFPRKFIPSFSWGGGQGYRTYLLDKAMETAERVMARRNRPFTESDRIRFQHIFQYSARYRND